MREVNPLELGSIHPGSQLVSVEEAATAMGKHAVRDRVAARVLVNRPAAESAQELSRGVDVEEIAVDWRLLYRAQLASFLGVGNA
jgi:hypothetical protein